MRLDHVSYAAGHDQLCDVVQWLGSALGASFSDGGRHPRFGTQNFVLPLVGGVYVEVVAALDHPSADRAPFGRAVRQRAELGGGWLGWVVAVDDIAPVERRLSRPAVVGHRVRPDGLDLRWKQIGVMDLMDDPQLPFFVQWLTSAAEHPPPGFRDGVRLRQLEISGTPATVCSWLGEPENHPLDDVEVAWVRAEEPGLVAVHFDTRRGPVRID